VTDLKFHFKINGFFSKRKSMCIPVLSARLRSTLYCFSEVFEFVHYKYSLQPSRGIFVGTMFFCTYWVVYLPSLQFSFIKLSRTYRIFRYWKSLQCLLVFSLYWFTQQTIMVLFVTVTTTVPQIWHDQRYFQSQAKLALCAEFDCNGYGVNGAHLNADLI
jgi:hypothetical protein